MNGELIVYKCADEHRTANRKPRRSIEQPPQVTIEIVDLRGIPTQNLATVESMAVAEFRDGEALALWQWPAAEARLCRQHFGPECRRQSDERSHQEED